MSNGSLPIIALLDSFELHLRARNRSPKTIHSYRLAVDQLIAHLGEVEVGEITRGDIEGFLASFLETRSPATTRQRYASLRQFFKWLTEEGEISTDPMARIKAPALPEQPVPVISADDLKRLIKSTEGNDFTNRRDRAILMMFIDTGVRLGEMGGLKLIDIDWTYNVALVTGKGSRRRTVPFGDSVALALDRYLRSRRQHPRTEDDALWLGVKGPLSTSGIAQMLKRRSADVGMVSIHPHQFRHTFAHQWLSSGGTEGDLMRIAGWRSLRCSGGTEHRQQTREHARHIGVSHQEMPLRAD